MNNLFVLWLKRIYAKNGIGKVKYKRGKKHQYLSIMLDYSLPCKLKIDMKNYICNMINEFPHKIRG